MNWIEEIKNNENEALKNLYTLYKGECIVWLKKHFNCDSDEALDIFQVTIVILYDNVVSGKLSELTSDIKTYLMGIARNKAMELIRTKRKYTSLDPVDLMSTYVAEEIDQTNQEKQLTVVVKSLEILGDPCKSLLQYFYFQKKNMDDITNLMGYKNADTTKNQKYKCMKRLQNLFLEHLHKNAGI